MTSDQLGNAISLVKAGDKLKAREILFQVILDDPHNETAWIWLVETMPNDAERIATLEQCLNYNPESKMAQKGLEVFRSRSITPPATTPAAAVPSNPAAPIIEPEIFPSESMKRKEVPEDETLLQAEENNPADASPEEEFVSSELVSATFDRTSRPAAVAENEQSDPVKQFRKKKAPGKSGRIWLILGLVILVLLILMGLVAYAIISGKFPAIVDTLSGNSKNPIALFQNNKAPANSAVGPAHRVVTATTTLPIYTQTTSPSLTPKPAAATAIQTAVPPPATPAFSGAAILPHPIYFIAVQGNKQIWRISFDGKTIDQITNENSPVTGLDVSQVDGTLAYVSNNQLLLADAGGGDRHVLVSGQNLVQGSVTDRFDKEISNPVWSPDGASLAYGQDGIKLINIKTNQRSTLISNILPPGQSVTPFQVFRPLSWSADGSLIAAQLERDTGNSVLILPKTGEKPVFPIDTLPCCQVSWSTDGHSLFVASPTSQNVASGLWQLDVTTGQVTNLINGLVSNTSTYTYVAWPKQSADGHLYYFYGQQSDNSSFPLTLEVSLPNQTSERSQIQNGNSFDYPDAVWAPDASLVVVNDPANGSLQLLKTDKSPEISLASTGTNLRWGTQIASTVSGSTAQTPAPNNDPNALKNEYIGLNYPPFPSELSMVQTLKTPSQDNNGYGLSLVQYQDSTMVWLLKYLGKNNFGGSKLGVSDVVLQPAIKGDPDWALGECSIQGQDQPNILSLSVKDETTSQTSTLFAWRVDVNTLKFQQIYMDRLSCVGD